jgi:hypothetical protein
MLKIPLIVALLSVTLIGFADAQTSPSPGPTNPNPAPNSSLRPGADLVINPTTDECQKGWQEGSKWSKDQFDNFCAQMKTSK